MPALSFAVPLIIAAAITPLHIRLARRMRMLDNPRASKIHATPMPTMGGLPVIAAVLLSACAAGWNGSLHARHVAGLALASAPLLIVGVWDDLRGCRIWPRLVAHAAAGLTLYLHDLRIERLTNPLGAPLELGGWGCLATIVWVMTLINAMNLVDGLDGLASGIGMLAALSLGGVGLLRGGSDTAALGLIIAGALLGFLPYNFPRARVFLGDVGSTFIGLTLAALSLLENRKTTTALTLMLPLIAMVLPVIETVTSVARRAGRGLNPLRGDLGHVHYRLLQRGLTPVRAVSVLLALTAVSGLMAILLSMVRKETALLLTGGLSGLTLVAIWRVLHRNRR